MQFHFASLFIPPRRLSPSTHLSENPPPLATHATATHAIVRLPLTQTSTLSVEFSMIMHTSILAPTSQSILFFNPVAAPKHPTKTKFHPHRRPIFLPSASANFPTGSSSDGDGGSEGFSWSRLSKSLQVGSERFLSKLGESVKKETEIDFEDSKENVVGFSGWISDGANEFQGKFRRLRSELAPQFIKWNSWENWKDVKSWDPKRVGALVLYLIVVTVSCRKIYGAIEAPRIAREKEELTEAYMEALIPEPTPANLRKLKKGIWRKSLPKGLRMKKFIEEPDGTVIHDSTYIGEDAWNDEAGSPPENVKQILGRDVSSSLQDSKVEVGLTTSAQGLETKKTWRERLELWTEILEKEKFSEQLESTNAKYVVEFDMDEVEKSLRKDVVEKSSDTAGSRALWISKRWWRYRPKLPYMYFLQKLDNSEVAAVVFTEDLKRLYVTMKEGFPLEYIVDIPLDPYLFETISNSGVEVDLLQKRQIHYFLRAVVALLPGLLMLWFISGSLRVLLLASRRFVRKKYNQFLSVVYDENFVMPLAEGPVTKTMYREVIMGGDVWDLVDEIMIYMRNPMQYYDRGVQFVRGILLSGPPGTGKTLFARTLANRSGLPFVYASAAEFSDSEKSGVARINEMFITARRNAPAFIFVDEIDAIAGRHVQKDPKRKAILDTLIAQLDGEKERTGVDRYSIKQAVIFICATNRPDELDPEFVRYGRIDRRVYVGLPDAKQRVQIFGVHSRGVQLAEDVDFGKLVYRTVGFSGADIKSLVNEAGIMSVRKGHSKIFQQDILDVLDKQLLEGMGVLLTEEEQRKCEQSVSLEKKRLLAVHEAGHVVLAHLFPRFDWHAFSQLLPGGKETAMSVFYPREEIVGLGYTTFGYMMMQMIVAHGGRCAEKIVFGDDVTDGGQDDLEKITKIAREMVISPRNTKLAFATLTKRIAQSVKPDSTEEEVIKFKWDDPHIIPADMTLEVSELFTRELTRYIEETEELAIKGLMDNRHILDDIAKELLEKSRVTGLDIQERIKQLSPVMFEDFVQPFEIDFEEDAPLPHNEQIRYQPLDVYPAPLHRC
ncbi:hypothetical protein V2J09_010218 [Rumex salicifolius]